MSFGFNLGFGADRLLGGSHLLKALGLDGGGVVGQLDVAFQGQISVLADLGDGFQAAGGGLSVQMLAGMLQGGNIGMPMFMPPPNMGMCMCPGQFAPQQNFDFGAAPGGGFFQRLMARQQGAQFERYLNMNPFARQQFEMAVGGRIVPDGFSDGRITVQKFPGGFFPAGGMENGAYAAAQGMFAQMQALSGFQGQQSGGSLFQGVMAQALQSLLMPLQFGNGAASALGLPGLPLPNFGNGGATPYANTGFGPGAPINLNSNPGLTNAANQLATHQPFQAGNALPTQGAFGLQQNDGGDIAAVLNDPSLTVEDKVTLMIMMIMKQMDKQIEQMAQQINQLQQQQSKGGGGGGGGKGGGKGGGGGGGGGDKSIDVETMKMKRLIDKRGQMFDMLRQIIDKYNQTAKGIIDSIGR